MHNKKWWKICQVASKESCVLVAQAEFYTNMKTHKAELRFLHGFWSFSFTPKAIFIVILLSLQHQIHSMRWCTAISHISKYAWDSYAVGISASCTFVYFHDVICDYFLVLKFNINLPSQTLFINRYITFRLCCRWFRHHFIGFPLGIRVTIVLIRLHQRVKILEVVSNTIFPKQTYKHKLNTIGESKTLLILIYKQHSYRN